MPALFAIVVCFVYLILGLQHGDAVNLNSASSRNLTKIVWPRDRIFFFASATRHYGWYCDMLASALANDITMHIYGWHDRRLTKQTKVHKIRIVLDTLERLPNDQIAMMVDAYDVLFEKGERVIRKQFDALNTDLVIGCEKPCYNEMVTQNECYKMFPKQANGYAGLNSGGVIGRVKQFTNIYNIARTLATTMPRVGIQKKATDQGFVGLAFNKSRADGNKVTLDCGETLFQNMYRAETDFNCTSSRLFNCKTKTYPSVIHFNGNPMKKKPVRRWKPRFWWAGVDLEKSGVMNKTMYINDEPIPFWKMCSLKKGDFHRFFQ